MWPKNIFFVTWCQRSACCYIYYSVCCHFFKTRIIFKNHIYNSFDQSESRAYVKVDKLYYSGKSVILWNKHKKEFNSVYMWKPQGQDFMLRAYWCQNVVRSFPCGSSHFKSNIKNDFFSNILPEILKWFSLICWDMYPSLN